MILRYTASNDPIFIPHVLLDYSNSADGNRVSKKEPGSTARLLIQSKYIPYPTVSTVLLTFNQEKFIEQAVESVLAQKGRIIHELIISDDGSTDGTRAIIESYCNRYPLIVRSIGSESNVGISENFRRAFQAASGKYVAVLEGDDYWIDEEKLDSQVTFLEENKDCSMVFSRIEVRDVMRNSTRLLKRQENIRKEKLDGSDFLAEPSMNLIGNFSCCAFRTDLMKSAPAVLFQNRLSEIAVAFYLETHGKIGYINKTMSVYRQHPDGVWTGSDKKAQLLSGLETRRIVKEVAREEYKESIQKIIDENYAKPLSKLA
jgi:glycosyltransferase involved in cell wall biosynthesis